MNQVFDAYSKYYDLLYQDKDYKSEAQYTAKLVNQSLPNAKNILELGCGTGTHAVHLAENGFNIHGIDISNTMLDSAQIRCSKLPAEIAKQISFDHGDIRNVRTNRTYDAVISLFHVVSYQVCNSDLLATFETAAIHLKTGGVFIFDFWYGPAVLTEKPAVRIKRLNNNDLEIVRIAEPVMNPNENTVDVNFSIIIKDNNTNQTEEISESHHMRYMFIPELKFLLAKAGFKDIIFKEWLTDNDAGLDTWSVCAVAKMA